MAEKSTDQAQQIRDLVMETARVQLAALNAGIVFWSGWVEIREVPPGPNTITSDGSRAFRILESTRDATFCWKTVEKPTTRGVPAKNLSRGELKEFRNKHLHPKRRFDLILRHSSPPDVCKILFIFRPRVCIWRHLEDPVAEVHRKILCSHSLIMLYSQRFRTCRVCRPPQKFHKREL